MSTGNVEEVIVRYFRELTPENLTEELKSTIRMYEIYHRDLSYYLLRLDQMLVDLDDLYRRNYNLCFSRSDYMTDFRSSTYLIMNIIITVRSLKVEWSMYALRVKCYINDFKKCTSNFMLFTKNK